MPNPLLTSYDRIPYASVSFPQTHPDRLATIGLMFGLSPADVAHCRVLELGCASGGNLLPMAVNLPGSEFIGIDLSGHQVDAANDAIRALDARNIRIERASILDIDRRWGEFDYVICHGVFSWVDAHVQEKILRICAEHLAPHGIAYVSYNTYPGWHVREMVRHMMRYHAGQFDDPQQQIEQARALLDFLASASGGSGPYGELLSHEIERLGRASDSYLFHEHLEQTNTPLYFHQFVERAESAGLLYLSEASVSDMLTSHFAPSVAETLERISPDILHLEQYMDFVRNRQFRQTLLCHATLTPSRTLTPAFMHGLLASSPARPEAIPVDLSPGSTTVFWNGKQRADVTLPASKAALTILMEHWPAAVDVDTLCAMATERAGPHLAKASLEETAHSLLGDLFASVMYGMVKVHTQPPPCTNRLSDAPRAHPLAAYQASIGNIVVNAHYEPLQLDTLSVQVLRLANGTRSRTDILTTLAASVDRGEITLQDGQSPNTRAELALPLLSDALDKTLADLTTQGLFVE